MNKSWKSIPFPLKLKSEFFMGGEGGGLEEANCYGTTAEEFCWARDIYEARWISYTTANLPPAEL